MDLPALLHGLTQANNHERRASEAAYEAAKKAAPENLAAGLLGAVSADPSSLPPHLKALAAVLLRRLISGSRSEYYNLSEAAQATIKGALLQCILTEGDDGIRKKVTCHSRNPRASVIMKLHIYP